MGVIINRTGIREGGGVGEGDGMGELTKYSKMEVKNGCNDGGKKGKDF